MIRILKLILTFYYLFLLFIPSFAQSSLLNDNDFNSNGYFYKELYWLRDMELDHYAEWVLNCIPENEPYITLKINALVTDDTGGGWRPSAELQLSYGEILNNKQKNIKNQINVTLQNTSSTDDINQYWATGNIKILKSELNSKNNSLYIKIKRLPNTSSFIAFHKDSIIIVIDQFNDKTSMNQFNRFTYWPIPSDQYLTSNRIRLQQSILEDMLPDLWLDPEEIANHNLKSISLKQDEIKFTGQIHNSGYLTAENVVLQFLVNKEVIFENTFDKLWHESNYIRFVYWKIPSYIDLKPGDQLILTIIADPDNRIKEINENNNLVEHQFLVTE